jgi:hypothetical protein
MGGMNQTGMGRGGEMDLNTAERRRDWGVGRQLALVVFIVDVSVCVEQDGEGKWTWRLRRR